MSKPETFTCPFCEKVIPYDDRCFIDYEWQDEDGNWDSSFDECCEDCFNEYA